MSDAGRTRGAKGEYSLAASMYSPLAQSAYHKRKQLTPLLLTTLLAMSVGILVGHALGSAETAAELQGDEG
jgi:hypothetical protein